jgi:hypothetical protein
MYSATRYRSDLKRAWKPVQKAGKAFGTKFRLSSPFKNFELCLTLCMQLLFFFIRLAFYSVRKLANQ